MIMNTIRHRLIRKSFDDIWYKLIQTNIKKDWYPDYIKTVEKY